MIPDRLFSAYHRQKLFSITPYDSSRVQPVSYDVQLGGHAMMFPRERMTIIDLGEGEPEMDYLTIYPRTSPWVFYMNPGDFVLGHTLEKFKLSGLIAAEFMGKSTLGRIGLFVHVTAGLIDPGWGMQSEDGNPLTVELFNASPCPIRLWEGMPIGQIVLHLLPEHVARPYGHPELGNHYIDDKSVAGSRGFINGSSRTQAPATGSDQADVSPDARGDRGATDSYGP